MIQEQKEFVMSNVTEEQQQKENSVSGVVVYHSFIMRRLCMRTRTRRKKKHNRATDVDGHPCVCFFFISKRFVVDPSVLSPFYNLRNPFRLPGSIRFDSIRFHSMSNPIAIQCNPIQSWFVSFWLSFFLPSSWGGFWFHTQFINARTSTHHIIQCTTSQLEQNVCYLPHHG